MYAARRSVAAYRCGTKRRKMPGEFCESRRRPNVALVAQGVRTEGCGGPGDLAARRCTRARPCAAYRLAFRRRPGAVLKGWDIGDSPSGRHGSGIRVGLEDLLG